jgi:hypothetical protein
VATGYDADPELSPAFLRHMRVLPLATLSQPSETDTILPLAMADPTDDYAAEAVALFTGRRVLRFVALPTDLDAALEKLSLPSEGSSPSVPAECGSRWSSAAQRPSELYKGLDHVGRSDRCNRFRYYRQGFR